MQYIHVSRVLYWSNKVPSISVIRLPFRPLSRMRGLRDQRWEHFHAIFAHLLQILKLRESLESIRFNGGNLVVAQMSIYGHYHTMNKVL